MCLGASTEEASKTAAFEAIGFRREGVSPGRELFKGLFVVVASSGRRRGEAGDGRAGDQGLGGDPDGSGTEATGGDAEGGRHCEAERRFVWEEKRERASREAGGRCEEELEVLVVPGRGLFRLG